MDGSQGQNDDWDCREVVHRLYHFLDGELTEVTKVEIRQHLDICMACLEAFEFEAELRVIVARHCREEVPASLRERIARAIAHESLHPDFLHPERPALGIDSV